MPEFNNGDELRFGTGFYTLSEAARLLRASRGEVTRWVNGYTKKQPDGSIRLGPAAVESAVHRLGVLTFNDLIELRYVQEFRDHGIPLRTICETAKRERMLGRRYPFTGREWATYFKSIIDATNTKAESGQMLFAFAREFMRDLDIEGELVRRWYPLGRQHLVVLDPAIAHGAPTLKGTRIRTETLYDQYRAVDRDVDRAAFWFDVDRRLVDDAVSFEENWRQKAA